MSASSLLALPSRENAGINHTKPFSNPPLERSKSNPAIKAKLIIPKQEKPAKSSYPAWYFLTLGIPILIETLSLFFEGVIHREKTGASIPFKFKYHNVHPLGFNQVSQFHRYNEVAYSILNYNKLSKAIQIMHQTKIDCQQAMLVGDNTLAQICMEKLKALESLLKKNKDPERSRSDLTDKDWAILDQLRYEDAKDYFSGLTNIFNTSWFKGLEFGEKMANQFQIDYFEAAIAESLSLSVAYIQGLDGKTLTLPVFDQESKEFRAVEYQIKEMRLGDALPCYIFESEDERAPPWFVIRGTQYNKDRVGGFESVIADAIDHECISRHIINKALVHRPVVKKDNTLVQTDSFSDIFHKWQMQQKKVILAGHSLGGTLVNSFAVDFSDTIKAAYSFSGAGVSKEVQERWQKLPKSCQDKIVNFDFEGDIVPSSGYCLIGRHFAIKALLGSDHPKGMYFSHVRSHLNRDFQIQAVDLAKENNKFARIVSEKIRVIAGYCLRIFLMIFGQKYLPDWWINRHVYQHRAKLQRTVWESIKLISLQSAPSGTTSTEILSRLPA